MPPDLALCHRESSPHVRGALSPVGLRAIDQGIIPASGDTS